ncbi:ead/Ea22-like family protein [Salmonella enterica subsp. enterica serovar Kentucky]|uniref:Ead/Ea22-like family protein n=3 Tax=Salmonella enterica TaxID=28901 RepID=A0A624ALP0_SALER|nr:ead/Ea22-like family protein [Salmonella enterica]EAA3559036.1 ead/Ea22-like family protein [Salmonella enterica subsp. enterica serovar Montevideo]EAW2276445.1 ead/Ea22-like family protein [Salmonella enterica subsp. enterica]EBD0157077.1 ead/Ea22-like family protein [Salmonella enterica subsp. enterica serovar Newport]EBH9235213.1 ead/Ea22-like family protein [Salmonella enterica subsp. enterica serovar Manhattan]EBQ9117231.1 ead/Ea22-like family protein [Salmonella enterica subsp. enteri
MSNIDKQALRERYSPKPAPECHICGKEMTIQRMSASRITYGCTGATYDDKGCHYAEGRSIADDHYEQSRVTVVDVSDPDVLALLDELEHYKSREERVTKLVLDNSTSWDALYKKLEAANRRSAELDRDCWTYENTVKTLLERAESAESACTEAARILKSGERMALTRAVNILLSVGECATSYQYPVVLPEPIGWKSPSGHEVLKKKDVIAALMSAGVPVEGD